MTEYIVREQQSVVDVAVTNYGSQWVYGLAQITKYNDIGVTDELTPGQVLEIHNVDETDTALQELKARGINVATYLDVTPGTPQNLIATSVTLTQIDLQWDAATGGNGYILERRVDDGAWEQIASQSETTYEDTDI